MARITVKPRTGSFAGREVFTNKEGQGIFTRDSSGAHLQQQGTSQTPTFRTKRALSAWLRRHYANWWETR